MKKRDIIKESSASNVFVNKKIKKHAARGRSWKVAYADFVTAMMAFFLLMWSLSQLSQDSRDNLTEYFDNYKAFLHSGRDTDSQKQASIQNEEIATNQKTSASDNVKKSPLLQQFKMRFNGSDEHIKIENVPGGVRVQIMDLSDDPMFEIGSLKLKPDSKQIMRFVAERVKDLPGGIIIEGHTDSLKYIGAKYTNIELSMDRAAAARLALVQNGVAKNRIKRVVGYGFSEPLRPESPLDPKNRRINIIILSDGYNN